MWVSLISCLFLAVVIASGYDIKENLPNHLKECYKDSVITTKDTLLPFTLNTFISLIRKIEDTENHLDIRVLSSAISQRYRFDGIQRDPDVDWSEIVIPYRTTGSEFYLYKLIFEKIIHNTQQISNNTLSPIERCTLHAMLSLSIDPWDRGDNNEPCSKISKYSSSSNWNWGGVRFPRDTHNMEEIEMFDPNSGPEAIQHGFLGRSVMQSYPNFAESQCPLENGVIYQKSGSLSPGLVLAGIATGLQPENVDVRSLFMVGSPRLTRPQQRQYPDRTGKGYPSRTIPGSQGGYGSGGSGGGYGGGGYGGYGGYGGNGGYGSSTIDNRYAATLSGVLAEVALLLGPTMDTRMKIGMSGGWNDTAVPKYYFISDYIKYALSDPKIRGSVDGLRLAKDIKRYYDSSSGSLKLSQVLGMYYSDKGMFGKMKACNRREYIDEIAPHQDLFDQTYSFAAVLHDRMPSSVAINDAGIEHYITTATDGIKSYIASMTDRCITSTNSSYVPTPAVDLHVVIDSRYDFKGIRKIITYLADNMEVNRYSSNLSVINGDGKVMVDSVQSPLDFYSNFTYYNYSSVYKGFDLDKLISSSLVVRFKSKLLYDKQSGSGGGIPRVVLFVISSSTTINNQDYIARKFAYFRGLIPDIKFIFLVSGAKEKFSAFAEDPNNDVFGVTVFTDISTVMDPVIKRISSIPKRLINPQCGTYFTQSWYNSVTVRGYLESPEIHYYRVHPYYFFKNTNARITIKNEDITRMMTVCSSRKNSMPISNLTRGSTDVQCFTLKGLDAHDFHLSDSDCSSSYAIDCSPFYLSIAINDVYQAQITSASCSDNDCKYPDMAKYSVVHQGLGCYSSAHSLLATPLLILSIIVVKFVF